MLQDPHRLSDLKVYALTIAGEARGESQGLQRAVGNLINNRWDLARAGRAFRKAKSIKDICLWPYQFSCWLPSDPNRRWIEEVIQRGRPERSSEILIYTRILEIAQGWLQGAYKDEVERADHYHCFPDNHPAWPRWARGREPVRVIGPAKFYRLFLR